MVKRALFSYHASFQGLSKEVWWLALITFINRAGTMVLPFLSLYLTDDLNISLANVGWIMTSFGLGSLLGSWLGGRLTDKIGYYKVMFWSLLITGFLFIGLQYVTSFLSFAIAIFITMTIADTFRPAMFVSLKAYSSKENQTRSLTLIRLAINLGFSFGPFLGGLIIAGLGYSGLFWVDGLTCISAVVLMLFVLKYKSIQQPTEDELQNGNQISAVAKDKPYLIFLVVVFLMGFMFLQLFTTIPLFYQEVHHLSEVQIGLIMSMNGFIIFLLEMPLVAWSLLLMALSFLVLNVFSWVGVLIIGMLFITFGEMLAFPFTNNFAMNRAPSGKEGRYLALYSMAFSLAHIFSAKTGMEMIDRFGYDVNWYVMGGLGLLAMLLMIWLKRSLDLENQNSS
jgi:predicted MFS family arabinose efflux permease